MVQNLLKYKHKDGTFYYELRSKIVANLKCAGLQFSMFFDPNPDIRMRSNELEKVLKPIFSDGLITLPNPGPTAPNEIPRILGNSNDGVYQLLISNVNASFSKVKFVSEESIENIFADFRYKLDSIYEAIIDVLPVDRFIYCGITVFLNVPDVKDANEFMLERFINKEPLDKISKDSTIYDIGTKYTFTQNKKYYINLSFNSVKNIDDKTDLTIQLDINDRYRYNFNKDKDNYSEKNIKDVLYDICKKKVSEDIVTLLKGE